MICKGIFNHSGGYPDFAKCPDALLEAECTRYLIISVNEKRSQRTSILSSSRSSDWRDISTKILGISRSWCTRGSFEPTLCSADYLHPGGGRGFGPLTRILTQSYSSDRYFPCTRALHRVSNRLLIIKHPSTLFCALLPSPSFDRLSFSLPIFPSFSLSLSSSLPQEDSDDGEGIWRTYGKHFNGCTNGNASTYRSHGRMG